MYVDNLRINMLASSIQADGKGEQLEQERYQLGLKVLEKNHAPLAQVRISCSP